MRILALIVGLVTVTGASAAELDNRLVESDALSAQLVYQARFGGPAGMPSVRAFSLQVANEGQRQLGLAPLRADYVPASGRFLVNGIDVEQSFAMRQEEGALGGLSGWIPLLVVIGAAGLIIVDGQDQDTPSSTGASGN